MNMFFPVIYYVCTIIATIVVTIFLPVPDMLFKYSILKNFNI